MSSIANDRTAHTRNPADDAPYPFLPPGWSIAHSARWGTYRAEGPHERGSWVSMRQAATAEAWALYATKLRSQLREQVGDGIVVSEEEEGYVRRVREAVIFNHARVPGGFVQVRQYDLRKTMERLATLERSLASAPDGSGHA
ncbi:hypothetical protein [Achromobacter xylosoxidans]|uniref:hypothetical protein n=1 Tax=Alcaligenes xylosoxydans xylosoxydans TaxID=85698 RepID=UPI000760D8AB|nr:hypothetical protein [Achromobacter xylosoxidans]KWU22270.1 hypothetical protein AS148_06415 [Achromobacter xylosoxidans]